MPDTRGYLDMQLLRFSTAGSVDDGKSTLIGRLLYDSKSIFEDQLEAVEEASKSRGNEEVNLALLTDGLRAEREQGITIDVAYRYFATPKRKFIIADTPGHIEYTRNMVTGASTAGLSIILIDARHGVLEQTVRHSYISSLLGIPHIVVAINKMDLVDYSEEVYQKIIADYTKMSEILHIKNVVFIPISARDGDNVVNHSDNMSWYKGPALLEYLETVPVEHKQVTEYFRYPVQYVIRPISSKFPDFRGYAGRVAGGKIKVGDKVRVLPSGQESTVTRISQADRELEEATSPLSIDIQLANDIDISRGDTLVKADEPQPQIEQDVTMDVCWFNETPAQVRKKYIVRQTTSETLAIVRSINFRRNINTLEKEQGVSELKMNDIAEITIHTANPLVFDRYQDNRITGSVIFIDPDTNETVGAGMIK
ncbi:MULTISPECIES: sulfate adenylyltransferase subunit 1 [Segatella]|jgi:sulfate adenylyltransferase subunit 1|uniref:sulfate adenylyltransferase n=4 Tax=Segatella TaxID=2974251 RepID=D8E0J7_9BACT|nr:MULTISPECIES: GTP-binding protein [Segatella]EFI70786.1 sulfate adenylyltransferase subunit 1 [Segatella baroniae B14]MDR4931682.1 GTP-binding protein [Segatella bryantii]UKK72243.1 GTP-binding protein [Segatella bryantii]UKK79827.1 GTP-binding protein [Segatella baroniae B14]SDL71417.1 sulfate adenylyltransferase subunit 1 [Segatella bryantii]